MLFILATLLLMAAGGYCWIKSDAALAQDDRAAACGYWALYAALGAVVLLGAY